MISKSQLHVSGLQMAAAGGELWELTDARIECAGSEVCSCVSPP